METEKKKTSLFTKGKIMAGSGLVAAGLTAAAFLFSGGNGFGLGGGLFGGAPAGADSTAQSSSAASSAVTSSATSSSEAQSDSTQGQTVIVEVTVREDVILLEGAQTNLEGLKETLAQESNVTVHLIDDNAIKGTYEDVEALLAELQIGAVEELRVETIVD